MSDGSHGPHAIRGPVWVYVLERRRAIEVWHTLMGDADPQVARRDTPHSLRAQFGLSREQNAVMGSLDVQTAEVQIMSIFASSPPFPTTELPEVSLTGGSLRSMSSSVLSALRKTTSDPASSVTSGSKATSNGRSPFKARPVPATIAAPDIVPRMSRAAALRAGLPVEKTERIPPTKERLAKTFENVPGHKRSETITVASTAPPVVAPRMTRAASLRLGQKPLEKPKRPSTANAATKNENKATFDGVPGHKRRESIAVPSTRPPSVTPRSNRSASLRQQKEVAPPSSFMCEYLRVVKLCLCEMRLNISFNYSSQAFAASSLQVLFAHLIHSAQHVPHDGPPACLSRLCANYHLSSRSLSRSFYRVYEVFPTLHVCRCHDYYNHLHSIPPQDERR